MGKQEKGFHFINTVPIFHRYKTQWPEKLSGSTGPSLWKGITDQAED